MAGNRKPPIILFHNLHHWNSNHPNTRKHFYRIFIESFFLKDQQSMHRWPWGYLEVKQNHYSKICWRKKTRQHLFLFQRKWRHLHCQHFNYRCLSTSQPKEARCCKCLHKSEVSGAEQRMSGRTYSYCFWLWKL